MTSEELIRDIEMSYEMLFAFLAMHGGDTDPLVGEPREAAWGAVHDQVRDALRKYVAAKSAHDPRAILEFDIRRIAEYARIYGGDAVEDAADRVIIALDGGVENIIRKALMEPDTSDPAQKVTR